MHEEYQWLDIVPVIACLAMMVVSLLAGIWIARRWRFARAQRLQIVLSITATVTTIALVASGATAVVRQILLREEIVSLKQRGFTVESKAGDAGTSFRLTDPSSPYAPDPSSYDNFFIPSVSSIADGLFGLAIITAALSFFCAWLPLIMIPGRREKRGFQVLSK